MADQTEVLPKKSSIFSLMFCCVGLSFLAWVVFAEPNVTQANDLKEVAEDKIEDLAKELERARDRIKSYTKETSPRLLDKRREVRALDPALIESLIKVESRGKAAIVRWKGPFAVPLILMERGQFDLALQFILHAKSTQAFDPFWAVLESRVLIHQTQYPAALEVIQQYRKHEDIEISSDANLIVLLAVNAGRDEALNEYATELLELSANQSNSWSSALANFVLGKQMLQEVNREDFEELARVHFQRALLSEQLELAKEQECQQILDTLTAKLYFTGQKSSVYDLEKFAVKGGESSSRKSNVYEIEIYKVNSGDSLYKISRNFGVSIESICMLNGLKMNAPLSVGQTLRIFKGKPVLHVNRNRLTATLMHGNLYLGRFPVCIGPDEKTPVGTFTIATRQENPDWFYGGRHYPFGHPENILGSRWLGFDRKENGGIGAGIGVHGTAIPESIPGRESLGCVRLHNEDVNFIYALLPLGAQVEIR